MRPDPQHRRAVKRNAPIRSASCASKAPAATTSKTLPSAVPVGLFTCVTGVSGSGKSHHQGGERPVEVSLRGVVPRRREFLEAVRRWRRAGGQRQKESQREERNPRGLHTGQHDVRELRVQHGLRGDHGQELLYLKKGLAIVLNGVTYKSENGMQDLVNDNLSETRAMLRSILWARTSRSS